MKMEDIYSGIRDDIGSMKKRLGNMPPVPNNEKHNPEIA
jgi:hypothetical protein